MCFIRYWNYKNKLWWELYHSPVTQTFIYRYLCTCMYVFKRVYLPEGWDPGVISGVLSVTEIPSCLPVCLDVEILSVLEGLFFSVIQLHHQSSLNLCWRWVTLLFCKSRAVPPHNQQHLLYSLPTSPPLKHEDIFLGRLLSLCYRFVVTENLTVEVPP